MSIEVVAVDVGGTNARFAVARVDCGRVIELGAPTTFSTSDYASFQTAWEAFGKQLGRPLPRAAAIAIAGAVRGEVIQLTNNPWVFRPAIINDKLDVDGHVLINDFEAIGHAVAQLPGDQYCHLAGPDVDLPATGRISIVGPGTGLGVAHIWRNPVHYRVNPTEGGHIDFAPLDSIEDAILAKLRRRYRRVSVERVIAGPAISDIYETLAALEGRAVAAIDDRELWRMGMAGEDSLAAAAIDRFCLSLGSVAGDIVLAQGAQAAVIAGGLGLRLKPILAKSGFAERFRAKGRFESMMAEMPVKLITHPQPGLYGAAAAYAQAHS